MLGRLKFDLENKVKDVIDVIPTSVWKDPNIMIYDPACAGGQLLDIVESMGVNSNSIVGKPENDLYYHYLKGNGKKYRLLMKEEISMNGKKVFKLSNPPYNDSDKRVIWPKIIKEENIPDYQLYVIPINWFRSKAKNMREIREYFYNSGLKVIKKLSTDTFQGGTDVKTAVVYCEKGYKGPVTFIDLDGTYLVYLEFGEEIIMPGNEISKKLIDRVQTDIKFKPECTTIKLKDIKGLNSYSVDNGDVNVLTSLKNNKLNFSYISKNEKVTDKDFDKNRVVTTLFTSMKKGLGESLGSLVYVPANTCILHDSYPYFIVENEKQGKNLIKLLTHPLYYFIFNRTTTSYTLDPIQLTKLPYVDLNMDLTNEDIYSFWNVTKEEIEIIEDAWNDRYPTDKENDK